MHFKIFTRRSIIPSQMKPRFISDENMTATS